MLAAVFHQREFRLNGGFGYFCSAATIIAVSSEKFGTIKRMRCINSKFYSDSQTD
jgi:regulator of extracellular matrix RemA (YlzA/DUF370 family)